jgi:curved DNA-binding protein
VKHYKNYYAILNVAPDASAELIKKAFRKLALQHHPDHNGHSKAAEQLFKEVNEAYEILAEKDTRQSFHEYYLKHFAEPETLTGSITKPARANATKMKSEPAPAKMGKNLIYRLHITFEEAFKGAEKNISYMRMLHGSRQTSNVSITVPPGIRDGKKLRLRGAGESLNSQQMAGDLVVEVLLIPHPLFAFEENDLILTVPLSPLDILLQDPLTIPTPTGPVVLEKVDWNEIQNPTIRLKDRGFPTAENSKRHGDLFVRFMIEVPPSIEENLKKDLRQTKTALPKTKAQTEFEKLLR